ncbi:uncharacterized protein BDV17DRAFT_257641 [Aspergillus undulatus]|uniref:uncharacterized protein n=1 Tax=Aspergillus undulatus TaxID=1810928 RepID=UPI003CCDCBA4
MTYYPQQGVPLGGSQWTQDNQPCSRPSTFQDFIYAFPKPRLTGRVMKPRSTGNSPSAAGRRRTTTMHSSPTYRQVPNQDYQSPLNAALLATAMRGGRSSRPVSWHPASQQMEYPASSQYFPSIMTMNSLQASQAGFQPQITPTAFDDSMQSSIPTDSSSMQQSMSLTGPGNYLSTQESSWQASNFRDDGMFPSYVPTVSTEWPFDMVSMNQSVPSVGVPPSNYGSASSPGRMTEPATPDFLPIQQFGDEESSITTLDKPEPEDELIGMGLYNSPETPTDGSLYGMNGKGLKLEETFTPSAENDADEDDAEDDQESANDSQPQQHSSSQQSKPPQKPAESMMQKSFFFEDDDLDQSVMPESRPSFTFAPLPCMNYGYGWI